MDAYCKMTAGEKPSGKMTAGEKPAGQGGMMRRLAAFARDRRGVAAVEFAFVAPLLLTLYFVTMEVSQAIDTNKKVSRLGSMVADLVTQLPRDTNKTDIDSIMRIGAAVLQPYGRTQPTIEVAGIEITTDTMPKAIVRWSRKMSGEAFAAGVATNTQVTVPERLMIPGTFLVRVSSQLAYRPVVTWTAEERANLGLLGGFDNIGMDETYHLRPRMTSEILCTDC